MGEIFLALWSDNFSALQKVCPARWVDGEKVPGKCEIFLCARVSLAWAKREKKYYFCAPKIFDARAAKWLAPQLTTGPGDPQRGRATCSIPRYKKCAGHTGLAETTRRLTVHPLTLS